MKYDLLSRICLCAASKDSDAKQSVFALNPLRLPEIGPDSGIDLFHINFEENLHLKSRAFHT
jgi:hypothetical protein